MLHFAHATPCHTCPHTTLLPPSAASQCGHRPMPSPRLMFVCRRSSRKNEWILRVELPAPPAGMSKVYSPARFRICCCTNSSPEQSLKPCLRRPSMSDSVLLIPMPRRTIGPPFTMLLCPLLLFPVLSTTCQDAAARRGGRSTDRLTT